MEWEELSNEIIKRKRAEQALQKAHDELESRLAKCVSELKKTSENLEIKVVERKQIEEELVKARSEFEEKTQEWSFEQSRINAELQNKKKQIKLDLYAEIEKLEEAIIKFAEREKIDVVFGSNNKVKIKCFDSIFVLWKYTVKSFNEFA